jgi:hypothetical protein
VGAGCASVLFWNATSGRRKHAGKAICVSSGGLALNRTKATSCIFFSFLVAASVGLQQSAWPNWMCPIAHATDIVQHTAISAPNLLQAVTAQLERVSHTHTHTKTPCLMLSCKLFLEHPTTSCACVLLQVSMALLASVRAAGSVSMTAA